MNANRIHETVIRDIVDVISDVKKSDEIKGIMNRGTSFRSAAQASSNFTLVFPTICSTNISIDNASMVSKATERKAVSMLQILFTAISISDSSNAVEYLKNFHTNLDMNGSDITVDGFMDALDKYIINQEGVQITDRELYEAVKQDLRNLSYVLPESVSEHGLDKFRIYPQSLYGNTSIVNEADSDQLKDLSNITDVRKKRQDMLANQLLDSDVKKANELVPTTMIVNFVSTETGQPIPGQMIIGVKAKLYPVSSTDLMNRMRTKNDDNNGMLKFIKATTREISFMRDFIFAIDKAKLDALSQSKKGSSSKLWKILERRALKSKFRRTLGQINDASAISTVVISQEEVEYLKKEDGIDVENPRVIRPIMEAYNLMGFCIIDESMEVAKFIYDSGDDIYENVSFSHLERETSDGGYKKVINLMTQLKR